MLQVFSFPPPKASCIPGRSYSKKSTPTQFSSKSSCPVQRLQVFSFHPEGFICRYIPGKKSQYYIANHLKTSFPNLLMEVLWLYSCKHLPLRSLRTILTDYPHPLDKLPCEVYVYTTFVPSITNAYSFLLNIPFHVSTVICWFKN